MIVGVDLDNTLICYDGLFQAAGVAAGMLPPDSAADKRGVRKWLVERDRERDFTILQGEVYGVAIRGAEPYPGALECLRTLRKGGVSVFVVSHKTRRPVLGPPHDLHGAALAWLADKGFFGPDLLTERDVFLEAAIEDKARRIAALGCTHFVDDMRSFLLHPLFPAATEKIWFAPPDEPTIADTDGDGPVRCSSWREIERRLSHFRDPAKPKGPHA